MPTFETLPICDREHPCEAREGPRGMVGTRYFYVATDNPVNALAFGAGLPQVDDPWDGSNPDLTVVERRARFLAGITQGAPPRVGWCEVVCSYATPDGSGTAVVPVLGKAWSEWNASSTTEQVYFKIDPDGIGGNSPINNGDGHPKRVGVMELTIKKYLAKTATLDYARMNTLTKDASTNDANVTAPPVLGHGQSITLAQDSAQYLGWTVEVVGDFLLLTQHLAVGVKSTVTWPIKGPAGERTNTEGIAEIYNSASFAGLW